MQQVLQKPLSALFICLFGRIPISCALERPGLRLNEFISRFGVSKAPVSQHECVRLHALSPECPHWDPGLNQGDDIDSVEN